MKNFLKRCWQRRWIRRITWTGVTLVTLYALLCTWVNWSSARQWRDVQAMLKAEGEAIDFRATTREPVPEAENFCAIPLLKDLALSVDGDSDKGAPAEKRKRFDAVKLPSGNKAGARPKPASTAHGRLLDLNAWAAWLRKEGTPAMPADSGDAARDVLAALANDQGIFEELAAGLDRPMAQWTPEWKTRELPEMMFSITCPHYSVARELNQTLALRSIAAARAGDAAKAHQSILIVARVNEANLNDPLLVGQLYAAADAAMLSGMTGELCDAHLGSIEDFARLESALSRLDFQHSLLRAYRSEMAGSVNTLQFLRSKRQIVGLFETMAGDPGAEGGLLAKAVNHAVPMGILDANTAVLADREFHYMIKPLRDKGWAAAFQASKDFENELTEMKPKIWRNPSWLMTSLTAPSMSTIMYRAAYAQTLMDQAIIACALERNFLEKGSYPDSLGAVSLADGKPLPLDPMGGKPMGYRKTADGKYSLWSVGFDGKDDGGKRAPDINEPGARKFHDATYVGDWVWDFPAK